MLWYLANRVFAGIYRLCTRTLGIRLRGLGWMLRRIKKPILFEVKGRFMYLNPAIAASYGLLLAGHYNEPETHRFMERLLNELKHDKPIRVIDVGANVGEMAIHWAGLPQVSSCIAFEPIPECALSIEIGAIINKLKSLTVIQKACGSKPRKAAFRIDYRSPSSSAFGLGGNTVDVEVTTLDATLVPTDVPTVILIDVEGAERDVLAGGSAFIHRERPLIIFKYNEVSRRRFNLEDVRAVLPADYRILSLRSPDGMLDTCLTHTWNCCAVAYGSVFDLPCRRLTC